MALSASALGGTLEKSASYGAKSVRAAFLSRGMAARPVGMGEAYTAVADDASAGSWNPGGLGQLSSLNAVAAYDAAGQDINVGYVAAALPLGVGVAGLHVTTVDMGQYDVFDEDGVGTGSETLMDLAAGCTWAFPNPSFLGPGWTGAGLEMVREAVGGMLVGLNVGGLHPLGNGLRAGWTLQHLGPMVGGFSLPVTAKGGVSWDDSSDFRLAADLGYGLVDGQAFASAGVELIRYPMFPMRAGYKWIGDTGFDGLSGVTGGVGVRLGPLGLDYAYQPFGNLATSHRVAIVYGGNRAAAGPPPPEVLQ